MTDRDWIEYPPVEVRNGDDWPRTFVMWNVANGQRTTVKDLTGLTFALTVTDNDETAVFSATVTVAAPTTGAVSIRATPAQMAGLNLGEWYHWHLRETTGAGVAVTRLVGTIRRVAV